jgi:hypothetical protein
MGFFSFIETFFFISLAITFVLIMLLVYHFKQRLSIVETKTDTMFEIMNSLLKEMKLIKSMVSIPSQTQGSNFGMFDMMMPQMFNPLQEKDQEEYDDQNDVDNYNDNDNDNNSERNEESPIKIINLENEKDDFSPVMDIQELIVESESLESDDSDDEEEEELNEETKSLEKIDYKSLEISQLRALAVERGIDPSKKKKGELIQLLQQ